MLNSELFHTVRRRTGPLWVASSQNGRWHGHALLKKRCTNYVRDMGRAERRMGGVVRSKRVERVWGQTAVPHKEVAAVLSAR